MVRWAGSVIRDEVLTLCAGLSDAVEDYPFGDAVAVFKIGGRMFALVTLSETPGRVTLKCDPSLALELRARHPAIQPGYHMNKRHWNTVTLDGSVDHDELREMVEHSCELAAGREPA